MQILVLFTITLLIPNLVFCGYPISDPYDSTSSIKILPYNLIDTNPTCFWNGVCPMFFPGGELGTFPNSEERFQHILHNMHRVFVNQSTDITLGYYFYGTGGDKSYFPVSTYCGKYVKGRQPLYWYSDANQLARWKQYDEDTCDQTWYGQSDNDNHVTCQWGTAKNFNYKSANYEMKADRCAYFGDNCGYGMRAAAFCRDGENEDRDRCMFESEALCGGNSCLTSSTHCDPIFADKYDYVGKGFIEGMNGACSVFSRYTKQIFYPLPIGAHFDERTKIKESMRRDDGKHFGLWLEYHDINETQKASACYALYDGELTEMSVLVSGFPFDGGEYKEQEGFYSADSYRALFLDYFAPPTSGCEPYAFICRTSSENVFRLPEDSDYYFGTEWIDWDWVSYENKYGLSCKENHYYSDAAEGWTVNGGPTLTQSDIWFYQEGNDCVGCKKIDVLECLSDCVYSQYNILDLCVADCRADITLEPTALPSAPPTDAPIATTTPSPTYADCEIIDFTKTWKNKWTWDGTKNAKFVEKGRQKIVSKWPRCGNQTEPVPELEFFYYFNHVGGSKGKLKLVMHICCGYGRRFAADYSVPSSYSKYTWYEENAAILLHRSEAFKEGDSWTDPERFGFKQYLVFSLIALMVIGAVVGAIYLYKKSVAKKERMEQKKSRPSERDLTQAIEMGSAQTMPGPTNVDQFNDGRARNDSTDGDNRYTKAFIKQSRPSTTLTAPPTMKILGHNAVPSTSYETAVAEAPVLTAPPRMSSVEKEQDSTAPMRRVDEEDDDGDDDDVSDEDPEQEQLNEDDDDEDQPSI